MEKNSGRQRKLTTVNETQQNAEGQKTAQGIREARERETTFEIGSSGGGKYNIRQYAASRTPPGE